MSWRRPSLGQSLKLDVLAEGAETEAQVDLLTLASCPSAQGYLFAKPMWEADWLEMWEEQTLAARATAAEA